jgi:hypothetical protein
MQPGTIPPVVQSIIEDITEDDADDFNMHRTAELLRVNKRSLHRYRQRELISFTRLDNAKVISRTALLEFIRGNVTLVARAAKSAYTTDDQTEMALELARGLKDRGFSTSKASEAIAKDLSKSSETIRLRIKHLWDE